ncbi:phosphotransferase [Nocardioides sp. zg-579]|uniref:Phosphotransferase n=1 Tax=Nocardioides marmotae TaxID=2663857 RepID=A0A6I3J649_9ACTN|nr:phosphotransferase family protein [Nocardioides marmotae]MCR6031254.1 phosphotransferase [Gordonia jinghuaiqii]MTB94892.1 phosphotransferase [Nocardioides marmotae]QKE02593.1 phosphotransferase family protein [Nocardioides marmotae]
MTQAPPPPDTRLQRSSRDARPLADRLASWLATQLPVGAHPAVVVHAGTDANGMSSETLPLDATWTEGGEQRVGRYVARVAPAAEDFPVFPDYALGDQYDAMRLVAELTDVPVPAVRWLEPTGEVLGTPFFLMDRVEGVVPQDVLPYNFGDNWLHDASPEEQRDLQDRTVGVVARLHSIPEAIATFAFLDPARHGHAGETPLARNLARTRAWYEFAVPDIGRSSVTERGLAWLEAHLPPQQGDPVLCWGDARIGNVLYRDFAPVAVLDWEMATVGPRELDLSWMVFAHRVFESITGALELPGMPHFLREEEVVATYRQVTGVEVGDLHWYHVYNAVQWCIVFLRTGARQIHFGEIERPEDPDALMHHKPLLDSLLAEVGA